MNAELRSDTLERPTLLVQLTSLLQVVRGQDSEASLDSTRLDVATCRGAMDTESFSQVIDRIASLVPLDEFVDLIGIESALLLTGRSGRPSGWPVTAVTSEDLTNLGHNVLVGVPAQELHAFAQVSGPL